MREFFSEFFVIYKILRKKQEKITKEDRQINESPILFRKRSSAQEEFEHEEVF